MATMAACPTCLALALSGNHGPTTVPNRNCSRATLNLNTYWPKSRHVPSGKKTGMLRVASQQQHSPILPGCPLCSCRQQIDESHPAPCPMDLSPEATPAATSYFPKRCYSQNQKQSRARQRPIHLVHPSNHPRVPRLSPISLTGLSNWSNNALVPITDKRSLKSVKFRAPTC